MASGTNYSTRSATRGKAVTTDVEFETCVALLCSADITATLTFDNGDVLSSAPLQKGWNPVQVKKVVFASGTIFAFYNDNP